MRCFSYVLVLFSVLLLAGLVLADPPGSLPDPSISPDNCAWTQSNEICDNIDNNCDGQIDEGNVCGSDDDPSNDGPSRRPSSSSSLDPSFVDEIEDALIQSDIDRETEANEEASREEREAVETEAILGDMNLSEIPEFKEQPVETITFWTKKLFIYGGAGLFLIILIVVGLILHTEKKRKTGLFKEEENARAWHSTLTESAQNKKEKTPHEKAQEYVAHVREIGFSNKMIKDHLVNHGWTEEHVDNLLTQVDEKETRDQDISVTPSNDDSSTENSNL